jgi:hypothetical protein
MPAALSTEGLRAFSLENPKTGVVFLSFQKKISKFR